MVNTEKAEVIKHAAVKSKDGMIFLGKCHSDCFEQAYNVGIKMSQKMEDQGFFTSLGRFVGRSEAMSIAKKTGYVDELKGGILFSEDIWSQQDGGNFEYDSIKGYW